MPNDLDGKLRTAAKRAQCVFCDIGPHAGEWKLSMGPIAVYLSQAEVQELMSSDG